MTVDVQKYLDKGDVFIGYNETSYSWDDLYMSKTALLFYRNKNSNIELVIYSYSKDVGMNSYTTKNDETHSVGTLQKPDLAKIRSITAKNSFRNGYNKAFSAKWTTPKGLSLNLSEIIQKTKDYLKMRDNKTNENQVRKFIRKALLSVIKEVITENSIDQQSAEKQMLNFAKKRRLRIVNKGNGVLQIEPQNNTQNAGKSGTGRYITLRPENGKYKIDVTSGTIENPVMFMGRPSTMNNYQNKAHTVEDAQKIINGYFPS